MQERRRRPWLIPLVFALVIGSLPVQMALASRVSEPFPGLFFPAFRFVPKIPDGGLTFKEASFLVNGTTPIKGQDLFGIAEVNRVRRMSKKYFPRTPDGPVRIPRAMQSSLIANITRATGETPHSVTVTWKHRRFDIETGEVFDVKNDPSYDVPLGGGS
jgi:hypothetical protein